MREFVVPSCSADVAQRLGTLHLEQNAVDLARDGYTVVEDAAPIDLLDRLRAEILEANEEFTEPGTFPVMLLERGPTFEEAVRLPKVLALMELLLGPGLILSQFSGSVKRRSPKAFAIHSDYAMMPDPFPVQPYSATAIVATEDFTQPAGCTRIVPGSHLHRRHPQPGEGEDEAVPIEFPKGSVAMWEAGSWHGNCPRSLAGERVVAHLTFNRVVMRPIEAYQLPDEVIARNPPEFESLLGLNDMFGRRNKHDVFARRSSRVAHTGRLT